MLATWARSFNLGIVKLLFIGDIVGEPGRKAVQCLLPQLRSRFGIDFVVANGENAAGGSGLTYKTADDLFIAGVDVITLGDHAWDQKEILSWISDKERVLRPLNYPAGTPGHGSVVVTKPGLPPVGVIALQGRTFMPALEEPFACLDVEVRRLKNQTPILVVDVHAEATSEKIALGRFVDGRVSAVFGTHTHVQTADEQVFPGGTAFLCDAGFTGPHESVLGRCIEPVIQRFMSCLPQRFPVATERAMLQGAWVEIDNETGRAFRIQRVSELLHN
jgi:2',3'-cyclic-nucleotide 2'-phosphodiesterase